LSERKILFQSKLKAQRKAWGSSFWNTSALVGHHDNHQLLSTAQMSGSARA
jgi:hypothetical protein